MAKMVFHESFGEMTFAQRAAYRKFNVSQSDHETLADAFGEDDHDSITAYVKAHSETGMYRVNYLDLPAFK